MSIDPIPEEKAIWHTKEKQGGKVLHTLKTRDRGVASAMMVAPELLEALENIIADMPSYQFNGEPALPESKYGRAHAIIAKAKGEV